MTCITQMVWYDDVKEKPVATRFVATLVHEDDVLKPYKIKIKFSYNSSPGDIVNFKEFKFGSLKEALVCYNDLKMATEAETIQ